jgi:phosphoribosylaminoimidazole-succinocarboxamide synthase
MQTYQVEGKLEEFSSVFLLFIGLMIKFAYQENQISDDELPRALYLPSSKQEAQDIVARVEKRVNIKTDENAEYLMSLTRSVFMFYYDQDEEKAAKMFLKIDDFINSTREKGQTLH